MHRVLRLVDEVGVLIPHALTSEQFEKYQGFLGHYHVQTNKPDVYPGVATVACRMARIAPALAGFPWWTLEL